MTMNTTWKAALAEALTAEAARSDIADARLDSVTFLHGYLDYLALADSSAAVHKLQTPLHRQNAIALNAYDVVEKAASNFFHETESQVEKNRIAATTSAALDALAPEFEGVAEFTEFRYTYEQALTVAVAARTEQQFFDIVRLPVIVGSAGERVVNAVERATRQSLFKYGPEGRGSFRIPLLG